MILQEFRNWVDIDKVNMVGDDMKYDWMYTKTPNVIGTRLDMINDMTEES